MPTYDRDLIERLTVMHIRRYANRVRLGEEGHHAINLRECRGYLALWESIANKGYNWELLTPSEQRELMDAASDEDLSLVKGS